MRSALSDKRILVTGASSGIGRALALALARRGNRVLICGRDREALVEVAANAPDRLLPLVWDQRDRAQGEHAARVVRERFGWLDLLVLNAGTCEYIDRAEVDADLVRRVFETNFHGSVNALQALLPLLRAAPSSSDPRVGRPRIVGVSSMSTYLPLPRAEAYGASKAALRYFLESLRVDLLPQGIEVSVVSPGFVRTPLTDRNDFDMPFIIDAEESAQRIVAGIEAGRLHIAFPRRMHWTLKLMAALPTSLQLALTRRITRS
jgi:NAD(P)-dependent dehydrogenase (short-subunit alcohol dehydrogenase family)